MRGRGDEFGGAEKELVGWRSDQGSGEDIDGTLREQRKNWGN